MVLVAFTPCSTWALYFVTLPPPFIVFYIIFTGSSAVCIVFSKIISLTQKLEWHHSFYIINEWLEICHSFLFPFWGDRGSPVLRILQEFQGSQPRESHLYSISLTWIGVYLRLHDLTSCDCPKMNAVQCFLGMVFLQEVFSIKPKW